MRLIKIERGQKITKPGFYSIPLDWYHADCCDGPSVSSSGLRTLALDTPLHFFDDSIFNPKRPVPDPEKEEAKHFRLGRAGHVLMLEPQKFRKSFFIRPAEFKDWRTDRAKAQRTQAQAHGLTVLTPNEFETALGISKALSAHPWHIEGILNGAIEASMIVRDPRTGIWLKSRPDAVPLEDAATDLKVMASANPEKVDRAIKNLGYDMQMALVGVCFFLLTTRTIDRFWLVVVENKRPFAIHVASLSIAQIFQARIKLRHALDTLAKCLKEGYWPSYGLDGREVWPTEWEAKNFERMQSHGLLPREDGFDGK